MIYLLLAISLQTIYQLIGDDFAHIIDLWVSLSNSII